MPQPILTDVHVQAALTNIETAYVQDESAYVADKVFPIVPVQFQADKYFKFSKDDFFRDEAALRADGTESAGGGFNLATGSYSAQVWAFHKDVGDQVRRNADPAIDLDVVTTKFLMQRMLIRRDRQFMAAYMTNGVWGTDIAGATSTDTTHATYWNDDANSDPITDIATGVTTILQNTGMMANKLVLSWPAFQALRKHPLVIDRVKYTSEVFTGTINEKLLAQLFGIDEVIVSRAVYNTSKENTNNATQTYSFLSSKDALLLHAAPTPGLMIPSAGYIFSWEGFTGLNNIGIRISQIPMPWLGQNTIRNEAEMAYDMQVVGADLGYHFGGIVQ